MTLHGALSIVVTVKSGKEQELAGLLQQIEKDPGYNPILPFAFITSIHFARLVICPAGPDGKGEMVPCQLVMASNYDIPYPSRGGRNTHLLELVTLAGPGLWRIFSYAKGFPDGPFDPHALITFLQANAVKADTFYVGSGHRSVQQIDTDSRLRESIQQFLDARQSELATKKPKAIREEIRQYLTRTDGQTAGTTGPKPEADEQTDWTKEPNPDMTLGYWLSRTLRLILACLLFLLFLPIIIPLGLIWVLILLYQELTRPNIPCTVTKAHWEDLLNRETGIVQNQFSAFGNLKTGPIRYYTVIALLRLTNFLAPYIFSKGSLSGIPTVHFARWLIISKGRQMLFLSNYDGNSEGYLRDFINIAARQLTLLFSHTVGYPKTWLMVFGGAKDANGFMAWARQSQLVTNVWYTANPGVTVKNIFQNAKIRKGLYGRMSNWRARRWLRLF